MTRAPKTPPRDHDLRGLPWFRRMRIGTLVLALGLLAICMYALNRNPAFTGVTGVVGVVSPIAYLAIAAYFYMLKRRYLRRIRALNGHACTTCDYLLTPELDNKPCPECGTPINLAQARADWIKEFGGWKHFPPP